ncbi:MAG TPA: bifunctional [glutamine synthetase] adenylyltransferase/[glutamine synthetase]-adenylyl-L-tyrosine phosphorylase [Acidimicrobiia bacterium]|nr:bifunctional [glutamine synthetase] adenylyltransferase/[glutamine synthetase]-adenylyl-L-tyrosine phosphorylase [Acidimicrobiia bacterium]
MTARSPSLARFGVSGSLLPRLESLGWVQGLQLSGPAEELLRRVRSGPDPEGTLMRLVALAERRPDLDPSQLNQLAPLAAASRGLWECLLRHPEWVGKNDEPTDPRLLVQRRLIEIAGDDLAGTVGFDETVKRLSDLADRAVDLALSTIRATLAERYPLAATLPFSVVAMGKWGGQELNFASDIDLIFVFAPAGDDAEASRRVALRLATGIIDLLSRPTGEGIAYRVDADLRPEGSTGPLARTVESYRAYYERWGDAWEFQALLKARPAAGDLELGGELIDALTPLVWPEVLPPEHVRSLRHLKTRAEEQAHPADLKRAPGGIRDVEFSIQLLQLIHGRADPQLRVPGSVPALSALVAGGYVNSDDAASLADSYRWLRTVEHRLQLWQLSQTHQLPDDRRHLALVLGYRTGEIDAVAALEADLHRHRLQVRQLHESLYYRPLLEAFAAAPAAGLGRHQAEERLRALGFRDVRGAAAAFESLTAGLSRSSRLMNQLLPLMLDWLAATPNPDLGLRQLQKLVADSAVALELVNTLRDRPLAAQRLCLLLGSSRAVGAYLDRIPEFLPRLADDRLLVELPQGDAIRNTARERMQLRPDRGSRLASLRRLVRRRMLRIAAADLLGLVTEARVAAALSDTADAAAGAAHWTVMAEGASLPLLIVAMGKWGGRELGYGSDLDLLYVTDTSDHAGEAARLASAFASNLGETTADGYAYQVDAGLRPDGRQGPLVRSLEAFRSYYADRAEPWERLALIKARPVVGPPELAGLFEELIHAHAYPPAVTVEAVRAIRHVKARVEKERVPPGEDPDFHLKLGPGGLADVEFLVQLHQLRLGHHHPEVRTASTLHALDGLEGVGALTAAEAEGLREAYQLCTRIRNRLFLQTGRNLDALPLDPDESARLALLLGFEHRAELREEYRRVTRRARRIFERKFYGD